MRTKQNRCEGGGPAGTPGTGPGMLRGAPEQSRDVPRLRIVGRREPTKAPGQDTIAGPLSNTVKFGHSHTKSFKLNLFYFAAVNALTLIKLRNSSIIM